MRKPFVSRVIDETISDFGKISLIKLPYVKDLKMKFVKLVKNEFWINIKNKYPKKCIMFIVIFNDLRLQNGLER